MATERQIQANKANANRSTGPRTATGKEASSQNAIHHGLRARTCIILKSEAGSRFDDLLASFMNEFCPRTANEHALVETMAAARWRLLRNWILQTATLEIETARQDPEAGSPPVIAAMAFRSLADSSQSLQLLQRYETSLDRQYSRALNNFIKLRNSKTSEPGTQTPAPRSEGPFPGGPYLDGLLLEGAWPTPQAPSNFPIEPNFNPPSEIGLHLAHRPSTAAEA